MTQEPSLLRGISIVPGKMETSTYNYEREFFQRPTAEHDSPEEHGEGSTHPNNVHFDYNVMT
jgi:hypothetical protein